MFDKSGGHIKFDRWHRGAALFVRTQRHQITENRVANSILIYFFLYLNLKKLPPPPLEATCLLSRLINLLQIILPRILALYLHHFTQNAYPISSLYYPESSHFIILQSFYPECSPHFLHHVLKRLHVEVDRLEIFVCILLHWRHSRAERKLLGAVRERMLQLSVGWQGSGAVGS